MEVGQNIRYDQEDQQEEMAGTQAKFNKIIDTVDRETDRLLNTGDPKKPGLYTAMERSVKTEETELSRAGYKIYDTQAEAAMTLSDTVQGLERAVQSIFAKVDDAALHGELEVEGLAFKG